jgi:hypothetical protein
MQWIVDLDDNIEEYKIFKKKETKTLKSLIMYVNSDNEIVNIIKDKRAINKPNFVSKEELINLLMDKKVYNKTNYNSYKITKFNINIELSKLEEFIDDNTDNDSKKSSTQFINNYDNLSEIEFENTIFNNLNYLFVILKERKAESKPVSKTKQNKTKSVNYKIKPLHKKTRKYLNIIKE